MIRTLEQWREKLYVDDVLKRSREILRLEREADLCVERREKKIRELATLVESCHASLPSTEQEK